MKRNNYISKNKLYMDMANLIAKRSKDPITQVGCVIVGKDDRVLSVGYNGFPNGISDDDFPWDSTEEASQSHQTVLEKNIKYYTKHSYVVHAELNAILNCLDKSTLKGSTLYTTLFPCNECTKAIIQSGISEIVYKDSKEKSNVSEKASRRMLDYVKIKYVKYNKKL